MSQPGTVGKSSLWGILCVCVCVCVCVRACVYVCLSVSWKRMVAKEESYSGIPWFQKGTVPFDLFSQVI